MYAGQWYGYICIIALDISNVCSYNMVIMSDFQNRKIDMICRHGADGTIMPIRFRLADDDGLM